MNKISKLFFILILLVTIKPNYSQENSLKSDYLKDPELLFGYIDSCAAFWNNAFDEQLGGYYSNIDKFGNLLSSWGTNKDMMTQSRNAYGFTRAFMITGKEEYLVEAERALEFMYKYAWDKTNGGWYNSLRSNGAPNNSTENKSAFYQHYAMLGPLAYYEATRDSLHLNQVLKSYDNLEQNFWDPRPDFFGYYDYTIYNYALRYGKSFNATVDAVTTHLLTLYLITQDEKYLSRMFEMADNMINRLAATMDSQKIGFAERYDKDWNINTNEKMTIMGHVLKTSWCLARIHQINPEPIFLETSEELFNHVVEKGYDREFGGPYKDYDRTTGAMLMWGNPDTAKAWWQMEQAIVAGLMLYDLTKNYSYLQIADQTLDFFMNHFVDHIYGEVYENRTRYGDETWGEHKGTGNKAAYHSIELGYYTYLYSKIFVHNEDVRLYYYLKPASEDKEYILEPIANSDLNFKIKNIYLNDENRNEFISNDNKINFPANIGGKLLVYFGDDSATDIVNESESSPTNYYLSQNYPNPFNPETSILFELPKDENVRIEIYNTIGELVTTITDERYKAGKHFAKWNSRDNNNKIVSSGIYFYRIIAGEFTQSKSMILMK